MKSQTEGSSSDANLVGADKITGRAERGRAASVANSDALGRPHRSVLPFGDRL